MSQSKLGITLLRKPADASTATIFREEAASRIRKRLYGEILLQEPQWVRLFLCAMVLLFVGMGFILFLGRYSPSITAKGYITQLPGPIDLRSPYDGVVTEVNIHEGQTLPREAVAIIVSHDAYRADGSLAAEAEIEQLHTDLALLRREESQLSAAFENSRNKFAIEISALRGNLAQAKQLVDLQKAIVESEAEQLASLKELAQEGAASELELKQRTAAYLNARIRLISENRELANIQRQISVKRKDLEGLDVEEQMARDEWVQRVTSRERSLIALERSSVTILKGPLDARVTYVDTFVGDVIAPSKTLASLLPANAETLVELFIPINKFRDIDAAKEVKISFNAYNPKTHGYWYATITSIADEPHAAPVAFQLGEEGEHFYKVTASLNNAEGGASDSFRPRYGMTLTGQVLLSKEPLWKLLFFRN